MNQNDLYHGHRVTVVSFKGLRFNEMDEEAFERLHIGRDDDTRYFYEHCRPGFRTFICHSFKCTPHQSEELYPEAFSILYFNLQSGKLTPPYRSTMQTYLNSVGWHLYHKRYLDKYNRSKMPEEMIEDRPDLSLIVDEALLQKEKAQHVHRMLEMVGDPCKTILRRLYLDEVPYKELAVAMNTNEPALRKRKFDCLGKLRKLMTDIKLTY
jgi:RNA polymerase sigma-70 factor (ECF subfamily)